MSKVTVFDKHDKPVLIQGRVKMIHAITAASYVKSTPDKWVLIIESKKLNGKVCNITTGIRPKNEKDRQKDRVEAKATLEAAKKALEAAESALDAQGDVESEEAPKGQRKASVRPSSK
jgi:hypothetical protein